MKILAISGSCRQASTNTALLRAMKSAAPADFDIEVYDRIGDLPVFSPDLEGLNLPVAVQGFMQAIAESNALVISSPEYVRSIPGGLKNAIDWLVSGDQIVGKPIALVHASHRGDDMLSALRVVLSTVSANFNADIFLRIPVMKAMPEEISAAVAGPLWRQRVEEFLADFAAFCTARSINPGSDAHFALSEGSG